MNGEEHRELHHRVHSQAEAIAAIRSEVHGLSDSVKVLSEQFTRFISEIRGELSGVVRERKTNWGWVLAGSAAIFGFFTWSFSLVNTKLDQHVGELGHPHGVVRQVECERRIHERDIDWRNRLDDTIKEFTQRELNMLWNRVNGK